MKSGSPEQVLTPIYFLKGILSNLINIECKSQYPIRVFYEAFPVGDYFADILIDDCIIIENKAAEALVEENEFQLINYLKATNIEVGLLLNFGKRPEFKRKIFTNDRKTK
jgi:GxxExxY protein